MSLPVAVGLLIIGVVAVFVWIFPVSIWFHASRDRCPTCESRDIRHSKVQSLRDHIRLMFELRPYRCRGCWTRFPARRITAPTDVPVEASEPRENPLS